MQVVFIGGLVRSGSTLLERLLGELPGVCSLGEVTQLWGRIGQDDVRCGCGSWFAACEFWTEVGKQAYGGWENVDVDRVLRLGRSVGRTRYALRNSRPRLSGERLAQTVEYADHYTRIYAAAAAAAGARVVVDSSKNPGLAFCLRWARDVDLQVVHLVRDPRGVAYSLTKRVPNPEREGGTQRRMSPLMSGLQWVGTNAVIELLAAAGPRPGGDTGRRPMRHRIRYEDLVEDPLGTIRTLGRFMGLDLTDQDLSYLHEESADLGVIHSAGGNRMRFVTGPVPLRPDDAWRAALPSRHRALVGALCLPLIMAYGYPARAAVPAGTAASGGR